MKTRFLMLFFLLTLAVIPARAQGDLTLVCPNGQEIFNAVEIIVNMRPGFTYTATAIGIDGFDPVLAVKDQNNVGLCADDEPAAFNYSADLPTTGFVPASTLSSQVPFSHNFDGLADISLLIGGFTNTPGEFIVILEGMAVTPADGSGPPSGDPFTLRITPNVTASGVPISTYMISVTNALDPLMKIMGDDGLPIQFDDGSYYACDDAGRANLCWGESSPLERSYVSRTRNRQLPGGPLDAMMTIPIDALNMSPDEEGYLIWNMTSSGNETNGDYMVVFHLGTGTPTGSSSAQSSMGSDGQLHQWASSASGTSQYGDDSWSVAQATGAPDTNECGDIPTAWASASATGLDTLTVNFDEPVIPSQINIYQTYNPGSIVRVQVANSRETALMQLENDEDPPGNTDCPGVFTIDIDNIDTPVDRVFITVDQSIGGSWNEIDAVELVGSPVLDIAPDV